MRVFQSLAGTTLPRAESIVFDWRVVLFTAILGLVTPLLFGLLPALRTAGAAAFAGLKEGAYSTAGVGRQRLLRGLVVAQFALALMLSVAAGLFVRSFLRVLATDPASRWITSSTRSPPSRWPLFERPNGQGVLRAAVARHSRFRALFTQARARIVPLPFASVALAHRIEARGRHPRSAAWSRPRGRWAATSKPWDSLKRGRFFTEADGESGQPVIIISETLARDVWGDADPVGRQIKWGIEISQAPWMTVVGVVGDIKQGPLDADTLPLVYEPLVQEVPTRCAA
jgi:hypothetical protein